MRYSIFIKTLAAFLCLCAVLCLFACGGESETEESSSEEATTVCRDEGGSPNELTESTSIASGESEENSLTNGSESVIESGGLTESVTETVEKVTETTEKEVETTEKEVETSEKEVETTEKVTETTEKEVETTEKEVETTEKEFETTEKEVETTEKEIETTEKSHLEDFEVVEGDGSASVVTPEGLKYSVSGYDSIGKSGFSFTDELSFTLDEAIAESFNRFTLKYLSDEPMKIYISYTLDGAVKEDYYFLEAGEGVFSGLILDFLAGKQGSLVTSVRVECCKDGAAEFAIVDISSEAIEVPERDYYVSGTRYTLGIDLGWGGTINYVSDNKCPITGVENMINKHDPGRLVQQSYYGTGEQEGIDFVWGSFNGSTTWPYNPVQGGCQGNLASRLVDFVVEDNYVYIKAQPMDWGKNGKTQTIDQCITPSYMENWYIIEDDYIKVDNRFVDFSGWEHPIKGQELPAFYTISYLDSFVWYDGAEPWTGDELSWRHELRFWGDSQYSSECSFRIKEPNTETWCAWVSTEDNYGIGLYSPNIDRYSAGRSNYIETYGVSTGTLGTKDPAANPTNYVAPWKQKQIISFEEFEFSYLICAGSVDEIRATFTENKDLIDNASLSENSVSNRRPYYEESMESMDFTVEGNEKFAAYPNYTDISYDHTEQALKLLSSGGDAHVSFDYLASPDHPMKAEDYKYLVIEYMLPETNGRAKYD